jgi:ubiquinone/menaquinone biosynthesis C-methylase UbiE
MTEILIDTAEQVIRHYEAAVGEGPHVGETLLRALDGFDADLEGPDPFAAFDQFHVGGLAATEAFAAMLNPRSGSEVLDAGSGLGGPSRYMTRTYRCRTTGVDLSPAYVAIARLLADLTGQSRAVRYDVGDLCDLPYPERRFDLVYTQHVMMNIHDRDHVYRECRRVLKDDGIFGFYDVLAADHKPEPHYPVPWSESPETSALLTQAETRASLARAGLAPRLWRDVTDGAIAWFREPRPAAAAGPSLATVMGPRFGPMVANLGRNLAEGRLRLVMALCGPA